MWIKFLGDKVFLWPRGDRGYFFGRGANRGYVFYPREQPRFYFYVRGGDRGLCCCPRWRLIFFFRGGRPSLFCLCHRGQLRLFDLSEGATDIFCFCPRGRPTLFHCEGSSISSKGATNIFTVQRDDRGFFNVRGGNRGFLYCARGATDDFFLSDWGFIFVRGRDFFLSEGRRRFFLSEGATDFFFCLFVRGGDRGNWFCPRGRSMPRERPTNIFFLSEGPTGVTKVQKCG
jgi:hypothetical protein